MTDKQLHMISLFIKRYVCKMRYPLIKENGVFVCNACSFRADLRNPTPVQQVWAAKFLHKKCRDLVLEYRAAIREYKEASYRHEQAKDDYHWKWYESGDGNRNSVAYRTLMARKCAGELEYFRSNRLMKYLHDELLPRKQERRRAYKEMEIAGQKMKDIQTKMYDFFEIPEKYR